MNRRTFACSSLLAISAVTCATYYSVLVGRCCGFTFDDQFAVLGNQDTNATQLLREGVVLTEGHRVACMAAGTDDLGAAIRCLVGVVGAAGQHLLKTLVTHDFWGRQIDDPQSNRSFRPTTTLSFWLQSLPDALFASTSTGHKDSPHRARSLHVVNVLLHAAATIVFLRFLAGQLLQRRPLPQQHGVIAAGVTAAACLFAAHPVCSESVASIVGRCEPLAFIFGVTRLHRVVTRSQRPSRGVVDDLLSLCGDVALVALSVTSKDTGITLSAVAATIMLLHLGVGTVPAPPRTMGRRSRASLVVLLLAEVLLVGTYLGLRSWLTWSPEAPSAALGSLSTASLPPSASIELKLSEGQFELDDDDGRYGGSRTLLRTLENPQHFVQGSRFLFLWHVQLVNLWLVVWPRRLCCEYGFSCIPFFVNVSGDPASMLLSRHFGPGWDDPRVPGMVVSTVALASLIIASSVALWRYHRRCRMACGSSVDEGDEPHRALHRAESRIHLFVAGCAWAVASYLPVSHLLPGIKVGTFIAERCLYSSCAGAICCVLSVSLHVVASATQNKIALTRSVLLSVAVLTVICLSVQRTQRRVEDWQSDTTLFEAAVAACPQSAKNNNQLALLRMNAGRLPEAARLLRRAIAIAPGWGEPRYHLARVLIGGGDHNVTGAFYVLRDCVSLRNRAARHSCWPLFAELWKVVKTPHGSNVALSTFAAREHQARDAENLAELYADMGDMRSAANQWRQAGLAWHAASEAGRSAVSALRTDALRRATLAFGRSLRIRRAFYRTVETTAVDESSWQAPGDENTLCNTLYWWSAATLKQPTTLPTHSAEGRPTKGRPAAAPESLADVLEWTAAHCLPSNMAAASARLVADGKAAVHIVLDIMGRALDLSGPPRVNAGAAASLLVSLARVTAALEAAALSGGRTTVDRFPRESLWYAITKDAPLPPSVIAALARHAKRAATRRSIVLLQTAMNAAAAAEPAASRVPQWLSEGLRNTARSVAARHERNPTAGWHPVTVAEDRAYRLQDIIRLAGSIFETRNGVPFGDSSVSEDGCDTHVLRTQLAAAKWIDVQFDPKTLWPFAGGAASGAAAAHIASRREIRRGSDAATVARPSLLVVDRGEAAAVSESQLAWWHLGPAVSESARACLRCVQQREEVAGIGDDASDVSVANVCRSFSRAAG